MSTPPLREHAEIPRAAGTAGDGAAGDAAAAAPFAYVTNSFSNTGNYSDSVIDTATNTVVATVPLGGLGALGWPSLGFTGLPAIRV